VAVVTLFGLLYALRKELKIIRLSLFLILVFVPAGYVLYTGPSVFRGPVQRIYSLKDVPKETYGLSVTELEKVRSLDTRIPAQRAALQIWMEKPVWGAGTGSFVTLVQERVDRRRFPRISTHNTYLLLLAENGVIGFGLYSGLLLGLWIAFRKDYKAPLGVVVLVMATAALATNCGAGWHILYIMAGLAAQVRSWQITVKCA
jgi:O-antigen ligase